MRNDAIERSINNSMLNIIESIFQKIEQAKRQQEINSKKLALDDEHSLSDEEKGEAEYGIY